jgi:histidinol-phosphate phosphatase family protein
MSLKSLAIDNSWTLFLDRDGVINERNFEGYITTESEFAFLPHVFDALKVLRGKFGYIFIITNQQGVGKGLMTLRNLDLIHRYMLDELRENEIEIDGVYVATNLRGHEIDRRKPNPAMANEAKHHFPEIDFSKSIMVGDTKSDMEFGMNLGMKTVLVKSKEVVALRPDLIVNNLKEFVDEIS